MWKIALFTTAAMLVLAGLIWSGRADDAERELQSPGGGNRPYGLLEVYRVGGRDDSDSEPTASPGYPDACIA